MLTSEDIRIKELELKLSHLSAVNEKQKILIEQLLEYVCHDYSCAARGWEAGEPTADGGYRTKIRGKWCQSKPIDERPKCSCGAAETLKLADEMGKK